MTNLNQAVTILNFGKKFFTTEGFVLAIISAPGSITMTAILKELMQGVALRDIILPLLLAFTLILVYNIVFGLDLWSGLRASKMESKGKPYFESGKGYSSMFKYFVVLAIIFMLTVFAILSSLANIPYAPNILLITLGILGMMASFFEIKSIGENIERMNKKRYPIFDFIEYITMTLREGIGHKIRSFFKMPPK